MKRLWIAILVIVMICGFSACRGEDEQEQGTSYTKLSDLTGKKIGSLTGTAFDVAVSESIEGAENVYFDDQSGAILGLRSGKVEAIAYDEPVAQLLVSQNQDFKILEEQMVADQYGIALQKDGELTDRVCVVIEQILKDGTMNVLADKWFGTDESIKVLPELDFTDAQGTLRIAHDTVTVPMSYIGDGGDSLGYDVELCIRIAHALNMNYELVPTNFSSLIAALTGGKADMAVGCMTITEERKKSVDFATSYYQGGRVLVVRNEKKMVEAGSNFISKLSDSFYNNFVKEQRWKLILKGLGNTMLISVLSVLFGTILGFGLCMLRRTKNKLASGFAAAFIRLIQGLPIVVFLMILYYIVFGKIDINAIIVAIIGFSFNFAAYVSEMMRTGIEAVDKGQIEAAQAIGFSKLQTFRKITFPQAARHFLPVYKGELISMVKMTSVVGYIAIQDLTKASDIIRGRTYEAFFPLVMSAVIYFILAYVLTLFIGSIEIKIDPKRRKREERFALLEKGGNVR